MAYKFTTKAAEDFSRLFEYGMDTFGFEQAEKYVNKLEHHFEQLSVNPLAYCAADHIFPGCRRSVCGVHAIYYRQCTDHLEIIRILNHEDQTVAFF